MLQEVSDYELKCALMDVQQSKLAGAVVLFQIPGLVVPDKLKSIKRVAADIYSLYAHPVTESPSLRIREKAGIKEEVDVLIYTASLDWIDAGIDFKSIDIENTKVEIPALGVGTFTIKERSRGQLFANCPLEYIFGLIKP